ncbi:hypothetical protein OROGR_024605 [Orobanche gracilis]
MCYLINSVRCSQTLVLEDPSHRDGSIRPQETPTQLLLPSATTISLPLKTESFASTS